MTNHEKNDSEVEEEIKSIRFIRENYILQVNNMLADISNQLVDIKSDLSYNRIRY